MSMPPDPATSTARSRRSRSPRTLSFLKYSQPLVEFPCLDRLHVGLDQFRKLRRFARRHVASGNPGGKRRHCARCIRCGSKCRQLEAYRPFASRWPVCFEQRQEQIIRVAPDHNRLTVVVANELASADERLRDALYGAPTRFLFKPVGGDFLVLVFGRRQVEPAPKCAIPARRAGFAGAALNASP